MAKITLDPNNARKHSDRNKKAIRQSLEAVKAGRGIVISNDDVVLAGNGVYEGAAELGIPVRVVETDGTELVAVKRTDLQADSPKARQLAILDNLSADTSYADYDADRLRAALENDPIAKAIAEQDENLRKLTGGLAEIEPSENNDTEKLSESYERLNLPQLLHILVSIPLDSAIEARAIAERFSSVSGATVIYGVG